MDPVQSRIRQRSSVFALARSSLVNAVFFALTGCFLTATFLAGALRAGEGDRLAMTFLVFGAALALRRTEALDVDLVVLAFGI